MVENRNTEKWQTRGFAAYAHHGVSRAQSTSGAIFPLLCEKMIQEKGIIYGAQYVTEGGKLWVRHTAAQTMEDAASFYGAKYVQSDLKGIFPQVAEQLGRGRKVLFSGTPCQIAGLKKYLEHQKTDVDRLLTVDNICHGTPVPKVWQSYVSYCQKTDGETTLPKMNMRDKTTGWSNYMASVSRSYEDGKMVREKAVDNLYMRAFMSSLSLQTGCCSCAFKGCDRVSDVTLGDFWGIWTLHGECDDDGGTSAVLIHSEKGMVLWEQLQREGKLAICLEVPVEEIGSMNRNLFVPAEPHPMAAEFQRQVNGENFAELVNQYQPLPKISLFQKAMDKLYTVRLRCKLRKNRK
ncbi:MAG: Coenzyme F420 hydrogenase/dehydrogenase, beta subunit C-terminal domain [Lachnospiraceae bacterium]|nr:Coenzyme F420 hydrogenase/dehydrogenase, beta subunit C-terminal domain [Lachnospiraceae bacterium]